MYDVPVVLKKIEVRNVPSSLNGSAVRLSEVSWSKWLILPLMTSQLSVGERMEHFTNIMSNRIRTSGKHVGSVRAALVEMHKTRTFGPCNGLPVYHSVSVRCL